MFLGLVFAVAHSHVVTASINSRAILNIFRPETTFGAGVDGQDFGDVDRSFLPSNVKLMRTAGLRSLTYRLRTELACESFHWNPQGVWSDPSGKCGYWTSNATSTVPILKCYGYRLPRRGDTIDQANNDGFSRLDDGSLSTFWKSNPYLDPAYTGEQEERNPQWILVDLGQALRVNSLVIHWANPYAVHYRVEYWQGDNSQKGADADGSWKPACQAMEHGHGGNETVRLNEVQARFVRIWLLKSSHTSQPVRHPDPRDSMGFAVREIELGFADQQHFTDEIVHCPNNRQTVFYTSSTDPWHRASDMDTNVEQPGFDLVRQSGLTNGLPMLVPVGVLYDTPDNAAAEISYLKSEGVKLRGIEIGEEPDGQCVTAEHYASLYLRFARVIRAIEPDVPIGGPSFQSTELDYLAWPEGPSTGLWINKFLAYLHSYRATDLFQFLTMEWYPFDDVGRATEHQLREAPKLLEDAVKRFAEGGIDKQIPLILSEYGYSAFAGPPEVNLPGAILNLDIVGKFLALGGNSAYMYGYVANTPIAESHKLWGNLMMLEADESGLAQYKLPTYYAARMMTQDWCADPSSVHSLVSVSLSGKEGKSLTCYAVRRPDGKTALLILNKSATSTARLNVTQDGQLWRALNVVQYSPQDYRWKADGEDSKPLFSNPPERFSAGNPVNLPPFSITVLTPRKF